MAGAVFRRRGDLHAVSRAELALRARLGAGAAAGPLPGALLGEGGMLGLGQAQSLVEIAVEECDRFYPAFQFVLWGDKTPAEALDAAMVDAAGEA